MRDWFEPRPPEFRPMSVEDRREVLIAARSFHEGRGDDALIILRDAEDPVRFTVAALDLIGGMVRSISDADERSEDDVWLDFFEHLDKPKTEYVRKAFRHNGGK